MNNPEIETRLLDDRIGRDFPLPQYATDGAAGIDLRACIDKPAALHPGETLSVRTGIAVAIPPGFMGLLAPRSGLGVKFGVVLANTVGIIDSDYRDEIRAALQNRGKNPYEIAPGERICQLVFTPAPQFQLRPVQEFSRNTKRGTGGFGSTGKF